jgi:hypothetical protein
MPADGLIAAHSMQGKTSARSLSNGSLSKFKPFHTNEKGTHLLQDSLGSIVLQNSFCGMGLKFSEAWRGN